MEMTEDIAQYKNDQENLFHLKNQRAKEILKE